MFSQLRFETLVVAVGLLLPPLTTRADQPERFGFSASSVPVARALDALGKRLHRPIACDWDALERVGITPETQVSLKARNLTREQMLDLTAAAMNQGEGAVVWHELKGIYVFTSLDAILGHRRRAATSDRRDDSDITRESTPAPPRTPAESQMRETLRQPSPTPLRYSFDFVDQPLGDVLTYLRERSGLNLVVHWPALQYAGVVSEDPVTLRLEGVTLRQALDAVVNVVRRGQSARDRVFWDIEGDVLRITTGASLDREMETRVYEVRDLLAVSRRLEGVGVSVEISSAGSDASGASPGGGGAVVDTEDDQEELRDALIEIIKGTIGEQYWRPQGKGSVSILEGRLVITQSRLGFLLMDRSLSKLSTAR